LLPATLNSFHYLQIKLLNPASIDWVYAAKNNKEYELLSHDLEPLSDAREQWTFKAMTKQP
jgi:hypothetical protein